MLALQAEADHTLLQHATASLYEVMASFVSKYEVPFMLFPTKDPVYRLLASADVAVVSRMCGILLMYKGEIESLKTRKQQGSAAVQA